MKIPNYIFIPGKLKSVNDINQLPVRTPSNAL